MKTQMRFQKIFMLVSLIIAALVVVYALIFCSGTIFLMQNSKIIQFNNSTGEVIDERVTGAADFFLATQNVSDTMLILGILLILAVCLNYIMGTHSRRKYYVTNYVAIGIIVALEIIVAIVGIVLVSNCQVILNFMDMAEVQAKYESALLPDPWKENFWTMPLVYGLAAILILDAVGFILNLVWKIKLMQGEKKLLENGMVEEVA